MKQSKCHVDAGTDNEDATWKWKKFVQLTTIWGWTWYWIMLCVYLERNHEHFYSLCCSSELKVLFFGFHVPTASEGKNLFLIIYHKKTNRLIIFSYPEYDPHYISVLCDTKPHVWNEVHFWISMSQNQHMFLRTTQFHARLVSQD